MVYPADGGSFGFAESLTAFPPVLPRGGARPFTGPSSFPETKHVQPEVLVVHDGPRQEGPRGRRFRVGVDPESRAFQDADADASDTES